MKRSLAMMLALIMVCALPGIASANGKGSINGAGITKDAVFIELQDITFADSVKVELFSDKTLLTTATLKEKVLEANKNYDYVTCCIPTVGEDEAWSLTSWIPRDKIVPNKAVLFVDGNELDTKKLTLDAEAWAALPGTASYSGSINGAGITPDAVFIELEDITFEKSVQVKLFSGETLLTTATLNEDILKANTYYQFVTCCIPTVGKDNAWSLTPWTPKDDVVPNKAVLVVDGHEEDTKKFELDAKEWAALPGTVPYSGSINGAGITPDAVFIELEDITFENSVQVKLFSGDTLLTTATLKEKVLEANKNYDYVTCCIPTVGEDNAWSLTPWIPKDDVVPNKAVLFVDGHEMNMKTFELDAKEWADLPGTVLPSSGSTTGGESHWHPPVTPAPVPVVVIPPKTGDMTIWQSILHFFGVI
ncbi:MAG: hypothetical protein Q4C92_04585 [Clostridia bacterium]|nr:hypothetical protein [Clostridia bacterium]